MLATDVLDTVAKYINSPPGQLAAGGVLAGIVWKFFERVEAVLTDQAKKEIAHWLRVKNWESTVLIEEYANWPETFAKVLDRLFGSKHLSWTCFRRSCIASLLLSLFAYVWFMPSLLIIFPSWRIVATVTAKFILPIIGTVAIIPDYLALLVKRFMLNAMKRSSRSSVWVGCMCLDVILTVYLCAFGVLFYQKGVLYFRAGLPSPLLYNLHVLWHPIELYELFDDFVVTVTVKNLTTDLEANATEMMPYFTIYLIPAFFTSMWLWLYAGAGFLLKAARRFDVVFQWFNRKVDIEKKPLQAIGLVAGALVALFYWGLVFGVPLVKQL
jgi:hypothetical protein